MSKNSRSFIPRRTIMWEQERVFLKELLHGLGDADQRLFCHILHSNMLQEREHPDGSPVPWVTIRKYTPGANAQRLKEFVEIGPYWSGHCRTYRVRPEIFSEFQTISRRMSSEQLRREPRVYFETGRRIMARHRSRLTDRSHHPQPETIRQALVVLTRNGSRVNLQGIDDYLPTLERRYGAACRPKEVRKLKGRLANDSNCRRSLYLYEPVVCGKNQYRYEPIWKVGDTGRFYVVGGALQSASGDMKRAGYSGIEGIINLDIRSSQVFIAIFLLDQAGLDARWLKEYYDRHDYEWYGEKAGIPGKEFKQIVIALLMGADLPKNIDPKKSPEGKKRKKMGAVRERLREISEDVEQAKLRLKALREVLGDLPHVLTQWHAHLKKEYIPKNKKGRYLPNAVGKYLDLYHLEARCQDEQKSPMAVVAAHLLQGLEAACIMEMIGRSEEAGFTPISCEHDGFIVLGAEPDYQLGDEITRKHGLAGMKLEEKEL